MQESDQSIPENWETIELPEMLLTTTSFHIPVIVNEVLGQIGTILSVNNSTLIRAGLLFLLQNIIIKTDPLRIIAPPFVKELLRLASNPNTSHPINLYELVTTLFPDNNTNTGEKHE